MKPDLYFAPKSFPPEARMRLVFLIATIIVLAATLTPSLALAGDAKKNPFGVKDDGEEAPPPSNEEIKRKADREAAKQQADAANAAKDKAPAAAQPPQPQARAIPPAPYNLPAAKAAWEAKLGMKFEAFANDYVAVFGQCSPAEVKEMGDALTKAVALIKSTNGPAMLPPEGTPPYELFFMDSDANCYKFLEVNKMPVDDMARKVGGIFTPQWAVNKPPAPLTHRPNKAVFLFGRNLVVQATDSKTQAWVCEGYGSYLERETIGHNENYSIAYQDNAVKFGKSWYTDVKKTFLEKKLRGWQEMFVLEPIGFTAAHYLTLFSMVACLNKMDAKAFPKMLQMIHDGQHSSVAVEKAYGKKVKDLEATWAGWIMTLK